MNEDIDRRSRKKEDVLRGSRGPSHVIESKKDEEVTSTQVLNFRVKSQIFWSDISPLFSQKVVRFRSDFWEIESDLICERPDLCTRS